MAALAAASAFFAATFGAGYILGWAAGARWLDDPPLHRSHHEQRRRA